MIDINEKTIDVCFCHFDQVQKCLSQLILRLRISTCPDVQETISFYNVRPIIALQSTGCFTELSDLGSVNK